MKLNKTYEIASFKALDDEGEGKFEAVVSVFGNVDLQGDRVMPGAFKSSLKRLTAKGDPIPVIWSHDWLNPDAHIGFVEPKDATEVLTNTKADDKGEGITGGLLVKGQIDVHKPFAAQVFDLLKSRRVREWSFAYDVLDEQKGKDGANELLDLDLHEVGPCLKGANPETYTVGAKSAAEAELKEAFDGERSLTKFIDMLENVGDPEVAAMLTKTYNEGPAPLPEKKKVVEMTDEELKAAADGTLEETPEPKKINVEIDGYKFEVDPEALTLLEEPEGEKEHGLVIIDESILEGPVVDDADAKVEGKPWHIEERGDQFCVIKDSDSSEVTCHDTREDAEAHLRALYANETAVPAEAEKAEVLPNVKDYIDAAIADALKNLNGKVTEPTEETKTTEPEGASELAEYNAKLSELLGEEK